MPTTVFAFDFVSLSTLAIPKSPSFIMLLFVRKMFCDFKSLWRIFLSCTCLRAKQIYVNQFNTWSSFQYYNCPPFFSFYLYLSLILPYKSPPSAKSITMHNFPFFVLYTSLNLTMFGCYRTSRILASLKVSLLSFSSMF